MTSASSTLSIGVNLGWALAQQRLALGHYCWAKAQPAIPILNVDEALGRVWESLFSHKETPIQNETH